MTRLRLYSGAVPCHVTPCHATRAYGMMRRVVAEVVRGAQRLVATPHGSQVRGDGLGDAVAARGVRRQPRDAVVEVPWNRTNGGVINGGVSPKNTERNKIGRTCAKTCRICAKFAKFVVGNKRRCKSIVFAKFAQICAKFTAPFVTVPSVLVRSEAGGAFPERNERPLDRVTFVLEQSSAGHSCKLGADMFGPEFNLWGSLGTPQLFGH